MTVDEIFPAFAAELESLTAQAGRNDLVQQIRDLPVLDRCDCGQGNCAHFYTAPKPTGSYGPGHSNVMLPATRGLIVYDVVDGRIAAIEVLDRPDVKEVLDRYLPAAG
jgi:hypothetical protein